MNFIKFI